MHLSELNSNDPRRPLAECLKLAQRAKLQIVSARKGWLRRSLIPGRVVTEIEGLLAIASEQLLRQDLGGALKSWEACVELCHASMKRARQGFVGQKLLSANRVREAEKLLLTFRKAAVRHAQAENPAPPPEARVWRNLAVLTGAATEVETFGVGIKRLIILTTSGSACRLVAQFSPYISCVPPEFYAPETGDYIYWPLASELLLTVHELHAIYVALALRPYDFIIASLSPSRAAGICSVLGMRDNTVISAALFAHLQRFGCLPPLRFGRICHFYRSVRPDGARDIAPSAVLAQSVKAEGRELRGRTARKVENSGRLIEAVCMPPLGPDPGGRPVLFFLDARAGREVGEDEQKTRLRLIHELDGTYRLILINLIDDASSENGEAFSSQMDAVYNLAELGGPDHSDILLRSLAQCYRPTAIITDLNQIGCLLQFATNFRGSLQPVFTPDVRPDDISCLDEAITRAGFVSAVSTTNTEELAETLKRTVGLPRQSIFAVSPRCSSGSNLSSGGDAGKDSTNAAPCEIGRSSATSALPSSSEPPLSVILISTGKACDLERNLFRSLACLTNANDEILVVDRIKPPGIKDRVELLASQFSNVRYLGVPRMGAAAARNHGAALAANPVLVFLDDEVIPLGPQFFSFHRKQHALNRSPGSLSMCRVGWAADPAFPIDQPLLHVGGRFSENQRLQPVAEATSVPWWNFATSNMGVKRDAVMSWPEHGFFDTCGDSRVVGGEFAYRLSQKYPDFTLRQSESLFAEYSHSFSISELLHRQFVDGMASHRICTRHPHLTADFGLEQVSEALREPFDERAIAITSDCLSTIEGMKSIGSLLPVSVMNDFRPGHRHVRSALLELAYLQGYATAAAEEGQNLSAAYAAILNQFLRRLPQMAEALLGMPACNSSFKQAPG